MPCLVGQSWTVGLREACEDAEIQSAQKRERRRRIREAKETEKSLGPSAETISADRLMPPPREVPRKVLKSSSSHRRNMSMGADADWSPLESYSSGASRVSPLIADSLILYKDAVRSPTL